MVTRVRADIEVRGPDGNIALLVEVKGLKDQDNRWLVEYRRNLASIILVPPAAYFMIVMADHMYLWRRGDSPDLDYPDFKAPTMSLLTTEVFTPSRIQKYSDSSLIFVVRFWLDTLVMPEMLREEKFPELKWVFESGLYDRIKGGSVHHIEDLR